MTSTVWVKGYTEEKMVLGAVQVYGVSLKPASVSVNGKSVAFNYTIDTQVMFISLQDVYLFNFTLSFFIINVFLPILPPFRD